MTSRWAPRDVELAPGRRVGIAVLCSLAMLASLELALQARAQWQTGQSVFSVLAGRSSFVRDRETGLRLLRPSTTLGGRRSVLRTNRYGLRGPDFDPVRPAGETRLVVLGSSTIMGTYARDDDRTSSARLQQRLSGEIPAVRVINAGVAGLTVAGQARLLESRLLPLDPQVLVWYPGINDFSCRPRAAADGPAVRLPVPDLPAWLLLPDLVVKNSSWLRRAERNADSRLQPGVNLHELEAQLRDGIRMARASGTEVVLVTSARSYRSTMPRSLLADRAATALNVRPCYTPESLAAAGDDFDELIRRIAREERTLLVDASRDIPAEPGFFGDSTHLSDRGEERLAAALHAALADSVAIQAARAR